MKNVCSKCFTPGERQYFVLKIGKNIKEIPGKRNGRAKKLASGIAVPHPRPSHRRQQHAEKTIRRETKPTPLGSLEVLRFDSVQNQGASISNSVVSGDSRMSVTAVKIG